MIEVPSSFVRSELFKAQAIKLKLPVMVCYLPRSGHNSKFSIDQIVILMRVSRVLFTVSKDSK